MAIGMLLDDPNGTREQYEELARKMFGGELTPPEPIQGLVIHTAGASETGWRIFDVWESKEDFDRFMKQYIEPVMGDDMPQGPQPEVYELANVIGAGVGATA